MQTDILSILSDIINIINYVFSAAVLGALAHKIGMVRWKAWVPVLSTWYAGEVADECTYRRLHKDYKLRKWALASMIACVFVALVGGISLVSFVLDYAEANPTELPDDIMGMLQIPGFLIGTCVMCGCLLICNIPAYFMYWQYFKYIVPQKAVLYFVLACIPGLAKWVLLFAATSESTDFDHYQDPYGTTPLPDANANQDFNEDIPNDRPTETNL